MEEIMNKAIQDIKEILENRNKNEESIKKIDEEIQAKVDEGFTYNNKMFAMDKESQEYKELAKQKESHDREIDKLEQEKKELTVEWGLAGVRNELNVKIKEEEEKISALDEKIEEIRTKIHENDTIRNWNIMFEDAELEEEDTKKMVEELKPLLEEKENREKGLKDIQDFANSISVENLDELSKRVMFEEVKEPETISQEELQPQVPLQEEIQQQNPSQEGVQSQTVSQEEEAKKIQEENQRIRKMYESVFAKKEKGYEDLLPEEYLAQKKIVLDSVENNPKFAREYMYKINDMSLLNICIEILYDGRTIKAEEFLEFYQKMIEIRDREEALQKLEEKKEPEPKYNPSDIRRMKEIGEDLFQNKEKGFEDLLPESYLNSKNDILDLVEKDVDRYCDFIWNFYNMSLQDLLVKMIDTAQTLGMQDKVNDLVEALKNIEKRQQDLEKRVAKPEPAKTDPPKKETEKKEPEKKEPEKKETEKKEPEKKEPEKKEPEKKEPEKKEPKKKEPEKKEPEKKEPEIKTYEATRIVVEPTFDSITIFIKGEKEPHVVNNIKELMKDGKTLKKHRIFSKTPLYAIGIKKSDPSILKALETLGREDLRNDYINSFVEPKDTIDGIQYLFDNAGKMDKKTMRQVKKYAKYAEGYGVAEVTGLKKGRIDKIKDWFYARKRIKLASKFERTTTREETVEPTKPVEPVKPETTRDKLGMDKVEINHTKALEKVEGEVVKETPRDRTEKRTRKEKGMDR